MSRRASKQLQIIEVEAQARDHRLRAGILGVPAAGEAADPRDLLLRGWVLAEEEPALAVELVYGESVIGRALVDRPREDIPTAHGDLPHAAECGFEHRLNLGAAAGAIEIRAQVVLDPTQRVPLATLSLLCPEPDLEDLVSVVIPCFKQAHFLPEAIESVLRQDHPDLEVIVVDDGSPDNVEAVASRYPGVRCLRQRNGGLAAARNAGLEEARGEFLLFLDADDRLLPEAIGLGLEELRKDPEVMMAAGTWRLIGEEGETLPADPPEQPAEAYPALLESCFISTPAAVLYRRALFDQIGGFDPSVSASADYDLYLRTAAAHRVGLHPHPVAEYRRHGANMTRDPELIMSAELAVLERQGERVATDGKLREALEHGKRRSREYHGARIEAMREGRR